jgi:hypothetical protein
MSLILWSTDEVMQMLVERKIFKHWQLTFIEHLLCASTIGTSRA